MIKLRPRPMAFLFVALLASACGGGGGTGPQDMAQAVACDGAVVVSKADFAATPTGRTPVAGDFGTACAKNTDCKHGPSPVCWTATLLNTANFLPTPGGYCSSGCTVDADCADSNMDTNNPNLCFNFGTTAAPMNFCVAGCGDAVTCRHPNAPAVPAGYACQPLSSDANGNPLFGCFPDGNLDCNPETAACTDPLNKMPGTCLPEAIENEGYCSPTCTVGGAECGTDPIFGPTNCFFVDFTSFGEDFRGTMCLPAASTPTAPGAACTAFDECSAGYQCDNQNGGTLKCEKLCNLGKSEPACDVGTSTKCIDAFGICSGGPGLCE